MDRIRYSDIRRLAKDTSTPKLSMYMPLHRQAAVRSKQDGIQLKKLFLQAQKELAGLAVDRKTATKLLAPLEQLLDSGNLWRYGAQSLAVFTSPKGHLVARLEQELDEKLLVNDHFHLIPLIEAVVSEQPFYLLALNLESTRLIYASSGYCEELPVKEMPAGLQDVSKFKEHSKEEQGRSGLGPSVGSPYYSKGTNEHSGDEDMLEYMRLIDRAVMKAIKKDPLPMILVGQDNHVASLRKISKYPGLVGQFISGNPSHIPADKLVNRAQDLMQPLFEQQKHQAIGRYLELSAKQRSRVSDRLSQIVEAATQGKVEVLLVPSAFSLQPTNFYEQLGQAPARATKKRAQARREEAIDQAILDTIRNGGAVYPLAANRIPGYGRAAAILRY